MGPIMLKYQYDSGLYERAGQAQSWGDVLKMNYWNEVTLINLRQQFRR